MSFVPFNVFNEFNKFNDLQSREVIDKHITPGPSRGGAIAKRNHVHASPANPGPLYTRGETAGSAKRKIRSAS